MKHIHARVEGRVQGVFFRDYTRREAEALDLRGWVRNMPDGAVEAVFCGERQDIERMLEWLQTGSPHAIVTSVKVNEIAEAHDYTDFQIRY